VLAAQVLVLAGTDRFDRPLTIGQMQGKFQPVLLPKVGTEAARGRWRVVGGGMQHFWVLLVRRQTALVQGSLVR
jgi:hypothetical protein